MNTTRSRLTRALLPVTLIAMAITACGQKVLDYRNAQIVNGKVHAGNADKPFSGKLTNLPAIKLFSQQAGFRTLGRAVVNTGDAMPPTINAAVNLVGIDNAFLFTVASSAVCDVDIGDGRPDGTAICSEPNSGPKRIQAKFKDGILDGKLAVFSLGDSQQIVSATFDDGRPDGKMEIYSPSNGKLIHVAHWKKGALSGDEEAFDPTTGNRILAASLVNGRYDGTFTRYAPDGKQVIYKTTFVNGKMHGAEDAFDPSSGKLTGHAEYLDGKLEGVVKRWNADGKLIFEKAYRNGEATPKSDALLKCVWKAVPQIDGRNNWDYDGSPVVDEAEATCREALRGNTLDKQAAAMPAESPQASSDQEICISIWTAAFHGEKGKDAIVTLDQLNEWQSRCRDDKRPT